MIKKFKREKQQRLVKRQRVVLRQRVAFGMLLLFAVTFILCICVGAVSVSFKEMLAVFIGQGEKNHRSILLYIRLPRVLACALAGSGLAVSGAVIQNVFQNPLAGPNIIGVNSGAGLAVVLCSALFPFSYRFVPFAAFLGALAALGFIYFLAKKTGASKMTLLLSGVCVNSLLNAAADAVHIFSEDTLTGTYNFRLGGFQAVNGTVLLGAGVLIVIGIFAVCLLGNELEIMSLGEQVGTSVGLNIKKYRLLFLALAALLAGASVSFAGLLGFVGLMAPHIARRLVGEECRYYLPFSALFGGTFVMLCDLAARTLWAPYEIPTGILLSCLGAPFFLYLLLHQKRKSVNICAAESGMEGSVKRETAMLMCEGLSAGYETDVVLREFTWKAAAGKLTVIIGPNGSGKSTLLKALTGQLKRSGGTVFLEDKPLEDYGSREVAKRVAYLPQSRNETNLSVGKLVLHGRFPHLVYPRHYTKEDKQKVEAALRKMGIASYKDRAVSELSGGERQKVYLAMALVQEAPVLLLDEPTTYLDMAFQLDLMQRLAELVREGKTVVAVLHDLNAALQYADELLLMEGGRLAAKGTPEELLQSGKLEEVFGLRVNCLKDNEGKPHYWFAGKGQE